MGERSEVTVISFMVQAHFAPFPGKAYLLSIIHGAKAHLVRATLVEWRGGFAVSLYALLLSADAERQPNDCYASSRL